MNSEVMNLTLPREQGQAHVSRPLNQLGSGARECPSSCDTALLVQWAKRPIGPFLGKGLYRKKHMSCSQREHLSNNNEAEILAPYSYYMFQDPVSAVTQIPRQIQLNM